MIKKLLVVLGICLFTESIAKADLASYIARDEKCFGWSIKNKTATPLGTVYEIELTSQCWQGINWEHQILVCVPAGMKPRKTMLLWNTGGKASTTSALFGMQLAAKSQSPVALLFGIPKQPLFDGKKEDALIAETFVRFLETKDSTWPLLFPMVKSLVKAMDALQAFTEKEFQQKVENFVVSGASKRGWTSWLTGAADKRVKAIAPLMIDTLNFQEQIPGQIKAFGTYSEQLADYTSRNLVPLPESKEGKTLWHWVDPYQYREKLTMPKMIINGANDPYWTLDALNNYWDGLKGDKYILYVPNAGHGLEEKTKDGSKNRDRAVNTLCAFSLHQVENKPLPKVTWEYLKEGNQNKLCIKCDPPAKAARLWQAKSKTLDFRQSTWEESGAKLQGGDVTALFQESNGEFQACFGEVDYEVGGLTYRLSTQVKICKPAAK